MITSFFMPKKTTKKRQSLDTVATDELSDTNISPAEGSPEESDHPRKRAKNEDGDENENEHGNEEDDATPSSDVEELLSSLEEGGWKSQLQNTFGSPHFARLAAFVAKERMSQVIFPPPSDTWTALNLCPLEDVKVVIVGQDPYHGPGQAHGLCFSVPPGQAMPPSLKNIYLELENDAEIGNFTQRPTHGHLVRWAQQGVLLLNNVLTVRKGQANSHQKKAGWEMVTSSILQALRGRKCVFLAWGKPALERIQALHATCTKAAVKNHVVISTSHPSPLGARKTKTPFLTSQCFSRCNAALQEMGLEPVDWKVDGPLP